MALDTTQLKADTDAILDDWGETLTIKSNANTTYSDSGIATQVWGTVTTVTGDWQDGTMQASGNKYRTETGLKFEYDALAVLPHGTTVEEGNRIYRADGSYEVVVFVQHNEDHLVAFLNKTN